MPKLTAGIYARVDAEELALVERLTAEVGCTRTRLLRAAVQLAAEADVETLQETVANLSGRRYSVLVAQETPALRVVRGRRA